MKKTKEKKAYVPYSEKLRDPRWQKRRLFILERDKWTCRECRKETKTLHVHHCWYEKGVEPWDHPDNSLVTLCYECHEDAGKRLLEITKLSGWRKHANRDILALLRAYGGPGSPLVVHAELHDAVNQMALLIGQLIEYDSEMRAACESAELYNDKRERTSHMESCIKGTSGDVIAAVVLAVKSYADWAEEITSKCFDEP